MMLREYLTKECISVSEMARRLMIHKNHIFMLLNGQRRPSLELAKKIECQTKHLVSVDELIPPVKKVEVCPTCKRKNCEG